MNRTTYQAKVTELIDGCYPDFEYPSTFEADVDNCLLRHLTADQAADELMREYFRQQYSKVWECTHDAWQIHKKNGTIETSNDYDVDHTDLCEVVGVNPDDTESWSAEITKVDPVHELLRIGDRVVCAGYGETVYFLRKNA